MSTRCQIKLFASRVYMYRHCDGYPEGVLDVIQKALICNSQLWDKLGDDEYLTRDFVKAMIDNFDGLGSICEGSIHGDEEYLYWVKEHEGGIAVFYSDNTDAFPTIVDRCVYMRKE